jgi:hypothetical protein
VLFCLLTLRWIRRHCVASGAGPRLFSNFFQMRQFSTKTQARAVSAVIDEINSRFGKGSIMYLSAEPMKM